MDVHTVGSASDTLDRIRLGGNNLILTANQRLTEIRRALDNGRFAEALTVVDSLHEKLAHLAAADGTLGRLAGASIVRVADVTEGMVVLDGGVVTAVGPCGNCEREQCDNVTLTFQNGYQVSLDCDEEVAVSGNDEG